MSKLKIFLPVFLMLLFTRSSFAQTLYVYDLNNPIAADIYNDLQDPGCSANASDFAIFLLNNPTLNNGSSTPSSCSGTFSPGNASNDSYRIDGTLLNPDPIFKVSNSFNYAYDVVTTSFTAVSNGSDRITLEMERNGVTSNVTYSIINDGQFHCYTFNLPSIVGAGSTNIKFTPLQDPTASNFDVNISNFEFNINTCQNATPSAPIYFSLVTSSLCVGSNLTDLTYELDPSVANAGFSSFDITLSGVSGNIALPSSTISIGQVDHVYLAPGTYTFVCIDNSTLTQFSFIINIPSYNILTATPASTICSGTTILLNATASDPNAIIDWTPNVGSVIQNNTQVVLNSTTTYTVTATSSNGCIATSVIQFNVNLTPTVSSNPSAQQFCGVSSTSISATNLSPAGTTVAWSGGITNGNPFTPNLGMNNYTVTATSPQGCTATSTAFVLVHQAPTFLMNQYPQFPCVGQPVALKAFNVVPVASTIVWSGGITNGIAFTPAASGSYTVTITSPSGCVTTSSVTVNLNALPTFTAPSPVIVCSGQSATLAVSNVLPTGTNITWSGGVLNGVPFQPATSNIYTATATSPVGCTAIGLVNLVVNPKPTFTVVGGTNQSACFKNLVTLNATNISPLGSTVSWTNNLSYGTLYPVSNGVAFNITQTQNYTVTVTSPAGCTAQSVVSITVNPLPVITVTNPNQAVCQGATGSITFNSSIIGVWNPGGLSSSSYSVSTSTLVPGNYSYSVTTSNSFGCTATAYAYLTVNPKPVITLVKTPANLSVCPGVKINLNATVAPAGSSFVWSGGVVNNVPFIPTPLTANTTLSTIYTVTATAPGGCTTSSTAQATLLPGASSITIAAPSAVCAGNTASITASVSPNISYTYSWTGLTATTSSISPNVGVATQPASTPSIIYTYTVTASNGSCSLSKTFSITSKAYPKIFARSINTITANTTQVKLNVLCALTSGTSINWNINKNGANASQNYNYTNQFTYTIPSTFGSVNGSYVYTVTATNNGCSTNSVYSQTLRVQDDNLPTIVENKIDFTIYPNPTKSILNLKFNDRIETPAQAVILDMLGKVVYKQEIDLNLRSGGTASINIDNLTIGSYFIKIMTADEILYQNTFIKE
jgi:Secretion system C-terminal sorting domain